jgi:chlorite dismutase
VTPQRKGAANERVAAAARASALAGSRGDAEPFVVPGEIRVRDASRRVPGPRQFVRYAFYRVMPEWRRRSFEQRVADRAEFAAVVEEMAARDGVILRSYSLVGTRGDADLMLWSVSERLEEFQELAARLNATALAAYLEQPYSYFAMTKRSSYVERHVHEDGAPQEGRSSRLIILPTERQYLFVYPFVKTRAWYRLGPGERQRQMDEHIAMGHRYPGVKINTTYSYGLDDQEFVVAFESDSVSDFLDLVQEMRASEASTHTVRDVPSFTCVATPIGEALAALG